MKQMRSLALLVGLAWTARLLSAGVVLNEISYHPPGARDDLQFVELHNAGGVAVDLSNWKFTTGIKYTFPAGTQLAAGGYLVVGRDPKALAAQYKNLTALGPFVGTLKHGGERITLSDASGNGVDTVKFGDRDPWPISPDGSGATLERVSAAGRGDDPANWAPSTLPEREIPAGTPGKPNSRAQTLVPATFIELSVNPWKPESPLLVSARVEDLNGVESAAVQWQVIDSAGGVGKERSTPARRMTGSETSGRYEASLPSLASGQFLRYRLQAKSHGGASRTWPDPQDLRPFKTLAAWTNQPVATVPQFYLLGLGAVQPSAGSMSGFWGRRGGVAAPDLTRSSSLLVVAPTNGGAVQVHDFIRITPRSGGWKVKLQSDALWNGVKSLNVIFESTSRWVLAEHLGYELFRRAGVPCPDSGHVGLTFDGKPLGYHLWVEQPNRSFLQRHKRDPSGELFKAVWYGNTVEERHEKKTQTRTGHAGFLKTVRDLEKLSGDAQWKYIEQHFDVAETASYYATCLLIENWDGYFNNHYLHHSPTNQQKWQIYPWDLDKTWGDYDGASAKYDWYTMSTTYGAQGDQPPSAGPGAEFRGPWGGTAWWRPGGVISAPLLANPEFRRRMLQRLRELLATEFTSDRFGPVIDDLEARLWPEVRRRLSLRGNDMAAGERRFKADINSFRRQVKGRSEYLRKELK